MNKKELYESVMKNVAKQVKRALNESSSADFEGLDLEDQELEIDETCEKWEIALREWLKSHIVITGVFATLELIAANEVDDAFINNWVENVMDYMIEKEGCSLPKDEIFIEHLVSFVQDDIADEMVDKIHENVKNCDPMIDNL